MSKVSGLTFNIGSLFGDIPVANFIQDHLHRLPFAAARTATSLCELGTWTALRTILASADDDVSATRAGQWYDGPPPTDADSARALCDQGYTVFIRHAERHHPQLAELAADFEATFLGPVNIHVFATPAGAPGFSWHYDAEDVFIIQTAGQKEYSLRKNTVNPWPLEETLPADMQYERELMPLMRVLLRPGDLLYIPCGYWHKAEAKHGGLGDRDSGRGTLNKETPSPHPVSSPSETSISLAVGVMSRSAMDVFDFLRRRLIHSLVWRQRLPLPNESTPEESHATYRHLFEQLAADLKKTFADPKLVADFLATLSNSPAQNPTAKREHY